MASILVVGAGVFGVTAARTLRGRGHEVTLLEAGVVPHPDAASTDISKVVRIDYGADAFYTALMEEALPLWRGWPQFRETGFSLLASAALEPGGFEHDSHALLTARGHALERLDPAMVMERLPLWAEATPPFVDGYVNPQGGWAASGEVVRWLVEQAVGEGVALRERAEVAELVQEGDRVTGVRLTTGERLAAETTVVAVGAWTATLVPSLAPHLRSTGHPVMHFAPRDAAAFRPPHFMTWAADISRTGWYGFPANDDGIVKVANHGPGTAIDPRAERPLPDEAMFRAFLARALPALADAEVVGRRLCLYCDSTDGDLWIDRAPDREGLVVAAGGSGHGFKLAPLLGGIIADVVEGRSERWSRLAWGDRRLGAEQARFVGDDG